LAATDDENIEERINRIAYENVCKNCEYVKLTSEAARWGEMIMELLGPNSSIFLKYQTATCLAKGIRLRGVYELGLNDGINRASQNAQQNI
jgi:hypothetical protein